MKNLLVFSLGLALIVNINISAMALEEKEALLALKNLPWFGISAESSLEKKVEEIPNGALIKQVIPGSNAEKMGLKKDDIIKQVDEAEITSLENFIAEIAKKKPEDKITLKIFRNGENVEIAFQLEDTRKRAAAALEKLGFSVTTFTENNLEGVIVSQINKSSYADYGGLAINDLIMAIDHRDFENLAEFEMVLSNVNVEKPVEMTIIRAGENNKTVIVSLNLGPQPKEEEKAVAAEKDTSTEESPESYPEGEEEDIYQEEYNHGN